MQAITDLKTKFDALTDRAQALVQSIQTLIPVKSYSPAAQEEFLLALSDLELIASLAKIADSSFSSFALLEGEGDPDQIASSDDLVAILMGDLVQQMVEQLGVSREIILPTVIKDLTRQIEMLDMVIGRAEAHLQAMTQ